MNDSQAIDEYLGLAETESTHLLHKTNVEGNNRSLVSRPPLLKDNIPLLPS